MKPFLLTSFISSLSHAFARLRPYAIPISLVMILIIGASLRLTDFSSLTRFNADQVRDARIVDAMADGSELPLLGPKAGGTTFRLGPAFYYFEYLSGSLFGHHPAGRAFFVPLLSLCSIYVLFRLLRFLFSPWLSLSLTLLYATSFYAIKYSRFAWNPNPIPLFVFAYLWLLMLITGPESRKQPLWYALIGIVTGIAAQLHTTLLVLLPTFFILVHIVLFFSQKRLPITRVLSVAFIIILLQTPSILFDTQNEWGNTRAFITGITTKTEKNTTLARNLILDIQLFAQGSTYVLSGKEPDEKWIHPIKLLQSRQIPEIALFTFGSLLLIIGTTLTVSRVKKSAPETGKRFLILFFGFSLLSFFLFLPIGNELNLRFFILLLPLPFVFLGLIIERLLATNIHPTLQKIALLIGFLVLIASNLHSYLATYDLQSYQAKDSAYGGISLGEAEDIVSFIETTAKVAPHETVQLLPFEFERSIKYLAEQNNMSLKTIDTDAIPIGTTVFVILSNSNPDTHLPYSTSRFETMKQSTIGRFSVLAVRVKSEN